MKKLLSFLLIFVLLFTFVACNTDDDSDASNVADNSEATCTHSWVNATCGAPKTCSLCKATEGNALGHTWLDATCDTPKTCSVCGATEGEADASLHVWLDADCDTPKTCSACGATEGEPNGHSWQEATCTEPKTCTTCGETECDALGHQWDPNVCGAPATCQRENCGESVEALPHAWINATLTAPKTCATCHEMIMQYDDYFSTLLSIPASKTGLSISGTALERTAISGQWYFHAKGVGTATLTDGDKTYTITVEKAKINLIVVMGQSNSVNWEDSVSGSALFENAMTDISSPLGTAYRWVGTAPQKYTDTSRGIHSTLLAELYAQSLAAGEPVKNVLIWANEITSFSGHSISYWANENSVLDPTKNTASMVSNCVKYYNHINRAKNYTVESKGVYWLQGEIDGSTNAYKAISGHQAMDPTTYEKSFMTMWNYLQTEAGLEYVAFLRVRRDVEDNKFPTEEAPDHNDLTYTTALSAQLKMIAENDNFYLATSLTENWIGTAETEHTIDISKYGSVMNEYSNGEAITDKNGNVIATVADGKLTTTMKDLYGSIAFCHYGKFGYTLIAADAAYNMYRALHGESFAIVQGDTSGSPTTQTTANAGETKTIDISAMTEDIVFRAADGSTAGTLTITVKDGETDITEAVTIAEGAHLGALNVETLKTYENVKVTVTYTLTDGTENSVIYTIVK